MSRPLTWILAAAAGVVLVIVVTAMIGNRDESDETVPAGEWAQSVCGAVGVWRGELESIVEDIRTPNASSTAGGEEPQSETPQGRTGLIRKGLERGVQATETMVEGIDNAGVPDTEQGEEAAEVVSDWADVDAGRVRGGAGFARRGGRHARGVGRAAHRRRPVASDRAHGRRRGARGGRPPRSRAHKRAH